MQDVETAELVVGRGECSLSNRLIGHITNNANGPATELRDLSCDFGEPIFATRE